MGNNLNNKIIATATQWKTRAKKDRSNRRNISRAQAFALELMDYMDVHNIKQTDLANKMGVSAQQVNKILRAKANLTFDTLDKIADALEVDISTPKIQSNKKTHFQYSEHSMKIVYKTKSKITKETITSTEIVSTNPILRTNTENMDSYNFTAKQI